MQAGICVCRLSVLHSTATEAAVTAQAAAEYPSSP